MRIRFILTATIALLISAQLFAQQPAQSEPGIVTLDTLRDYQPKSLGPVEWEADSRGYLMLEPSATNGITTNGLVATIVLTNPAGEYFSAPT